MHDLIFVSLEDWDEVWRRNQFLCSGYARRHPGSQILFVGLARDVSNQLRRGRIGNLFSARTYRVTDDANITVTHPVKWLPNSVGWCRRFNEWLMRLQVWRIARRLKLHRPVLWVNAHAAVHMTRGRAEIDGVTMTGSGGGSRPYRTVIYDVTDDWTELGQSDAAARLVREQDAELCRRADAVIVCSRRLLEMKSPLARQVHLIPNGVDADHYRKVLDGIGPLPRNLTLEKAGAGIYGDDSSGSG